MCLIVKDPIPRKRIKGYKVFYVYRYGFTTYYRGVFVPDSAEKTSLAGIVLRPFIPLTLERYFRMLELGRGMIHGFRTKAALRDFLQGSRRSLNICVYTATFKNALIGVRGDVCGTECVLHRRVYTSPLAREYLKGGKKR